MDVKAIRERTGMTQAALARGAGIAPSNLAAMESGSRRASPEMIDRLVRAAGLRRPSDVLGERRDEVLAVIASAGGRDARVFGSCARREDTPLSDIDLFVTPTPGMAWRFVGLPSRLTEMLGVKVDVIDGRTTNPRLAQAQREAVDL